MRVTGSLSILQLLERGERKLERLRMSGKGGWKMSAWFRDTWFGPVRKQAPSCWGGPCRVGGPSED